MPITASPTMQTMSPTLQLATIQPPSSQMMAIQQAYASFTSLQQHGQIIPTGAPAQASTLVQTTTLAPPPSSPSPPPASNNLPVVPSAVSEHGWLPKTGVIWQTASPIQTQMDAGLSATYSVNTRTYDTDTPAPVIEYMPIAGGNAAGGAQSGALNMDADDAGFTPTSPPCANGVCTNCFPLSVQHDPVQYPLSA
ncbi:unnamed protein product [Sphagnum balticum]